LKEICFFLITAKFISHTISGTCIYEFYFWYLQSNNEETYSTLHHSELLPRKDSTNIESLYEQVRVPAVD